MDRAPAGGGYSLGMSLAVVQALSALVSLVAMVQAAAQVEHSTVHLLLAVLEMGSWDGMLC